MSVIVYVMKRLLLVLLIVLLSTSPLGIASAHTKDSYSIERITVRTYAFKALNDIKQFNCLDYVITKESHWNPLAANPSSTAFGIGQMLGENSKDPFVQLARVMAYAKHRYTSWCNAKSHHVRKGWY